VKRSPLACPRAAARCRREQWVRSSDAIAVDNQQPTLDRLVDRGWIDDRRESRHPKVDAESNRKQSLA
jgi:hypothetical protein